MMNNGQPAPEIVDPATAYVEAANSLVYRLSELMFGSLLASYVLGFVGFAAATTSGQVDLRSLIHEPRSYHYLFTSGSFAYVTAGLYVSYHSSILTMPHLQYRKMVADFSIALLQASLFGLAMLRPVLYAPLMGLLLGFVWFRKYLAYRGLRTELCGGIPSKGADGRPNPTQVYTRFDQLLGASKEPLKGWSKPGKHQVGAVVLMIFVGVVLLVLPHVWHLPGVRWLWVQGGVTIVISCLLSWRGMKVINERADFLVNEKKREALKQEYDTFLKHLREPFISDHA